MRLSGDGWALDLTEHPQGLHLANYEGEVGAMPDAYATIVKQFPGKTLFVLTDTDNKPMLAMLARAGFQLQSYLLVKTWNQ